MTWCHPIRGPRLHARHTTIKKGVNQLRLTPLILLAEPTRLELATSGVTGQPGKHTS